MIEPRNLLTIDCSKKKLLWLDDLEKLLNIGKNLEYHFLLCQLDIGGIAMSAVVNNSIHVQVQVVNDGDMCAGYWLIDEGVSFTQPAIKLWNACKEKCCSERPSFMTRRIQAREP